MFYTSYIMKHLLRLLLVLTLTGCTPSQPYLTVPSIPLGIDANHNTIDDTQDLVTAARAQIGVVTKYDTAYVSGGYPPDDSGVCADVLWRAFQSLDRDLKTEVSKDIANSPRTYPNVNKPDGNIDFRRVETLRNFFKKHARSLTLEVIPGDAENLTQWQGGDIVTYAQMQGGLWHIAIISDKRRPDGVPFLIHNYGRGVVEDDKLTSWPSKITGHFRLGAE